MEKFTISDCIKVVAICGGKSLKKNELSHLSRVQLLEIMRDQEKENEQLRKRVKELEQKLSEKKIFLNQCGNRCGSLAEAALSASKFFESVDQASRLYMEGIIDLYDELEKRVKQTNPGNRGAFRSDRKI